VPGNSNVSTSPGSDYPSPWSYPHSPAARSSFSESDLMSTIMDVESQQSAYVDQFPEFLIFPSQTTNTNGISPMNGTMEQHSPPSSSNNTIIGDDHDMDGNGDRNIMQQVIRVLQGNGISNNPLFGVNNNEQMMNFTQL